MEALSSDEHDPNLNALALAPPPEPSPLRLAEILGCPENFSIEYEMESPFDPRNA